MEAGRCGREESPKQTGPHFQHWPTLAPVKGGSRLASEGMFFLSLRTEVGCNHFQPQECALHAALSSHLPARAAGAPPSGENRFGELPWGQGSWAAGPADHGAGPNWLCSGCTENAPSPIRTLQPRVGHSACTGTGQGTVAPEAAHAFKVRDLVEETEVLKESTNNKKISIEVIGLSLQISVTYETLNS